MMPAASAPTSPGPRWGGLALVLLVLVAAIGAVTAGLREAHRAGAVGSGRDQAGGHMERCLVCHDVEEESPGGVHAADALGCSSCHLGNPLALDADRAHVGLEREPGALSTVARTCGREGCHEREAALVVPSLMATARGIVAVDRWAFGEAPVPDGSTGVAEVLGSAQPTPAEDHLSRLCTGCHLGTRAVNRDDAQRGASGCAACHSEPALESSGSPHVPVDAHVPDSRCLGCHSRSARISLAYQGLAEVRPKETGVDATLLFDGRLGRHLPADVHSEAGLGCVDCHPYPDLMGDGHLYAHQEEQVAVSCESCHEAADAFDVVASSEMTDPITRDLLRLRGQDLPATELLRTTRDGVVLWTVQGSSSGVSWSQVSKGDGVKHSIKPVPDDAEHDLEGHEALSCQACHSAWIPWCGDCHTAFDPTSEQWDFGRAALSPGAWVESASRFGVEEPALALRRDRVVPAAPGMVMSLQAGAAGGQSLDRRWYAAWDPHTTRKEARTCDGCHRSAHALGLGDPAWTTRQAGEPAAGTRTDLRSFANAELERILRAGACTPCHDRADDAIYVGFEASYRKVAKRRGRCLWDGTVPAP
jgi:hypothetical protein